MKGNLINSTHTIVTHSTSIAIRRFSAFLLLYGKKEVEEERKLLKINCNIIHNRYDINLIFIFPPINHSLTNDRPHKFIYLWLCPFLPLLGDIIKRVRIIFLHFHDKFLTCTGLGRESVELQGCWVWTVLNAFPFEAIRLCLQNVSKHFSIPLSATYSSRHLLFQLLDIKSHASLKN